MLGGRYYPMGVFTPVYPNIKKKKGKQLDAKHDKSWKWSDLELTNWMCTKRWFYRNFASSQTSFAAFPLHSSLSVTELIPY